MINAFPQRLPQMLVLLKVQYKEGYLELDLEIIIFKLSLILLSGEVHTTILFPVGCQGSEGLV